jgi:CRISPR-associated protein Cas6
MILDYLFPLTSSIIPADHGYFLYCAVTGLLPKVHLTGAAAEDPDNPWARVAIHPIWGEPAGTRSIRIERTSRLAIRAPHELRSEFLSLAGKSLRVGQATIRLGIPAPRFLAPSERLRSRLVVIKGFQEPEAFLGAARRQMQALGIQGELSIPQRTALRPVEGWKGSQGGAEIRRTLQIRDKVVVGFALEVSGLSPQDSVRLQETGLGGRRRFGCGVFVGRVDKPE